MRKGTESMVLTVNIILDSIKNFRNLHKYSKDVIHGSIQFTIVLYIFAAVFYYMAPYTPDYIRSIHYYMAAIETAPVILASGIICGLISDLALRKKNDQDEKTDNNDRNSDKKD